MIILTNTGGIAATNSYLVADQSTGDAVLIDAPNDTTAPLLDEAARRGWRLNALWLTHGHFDHTADHAVVTGRFPGAKLLMHRLDERLLQHPKSAMFALPFVIPPRSADSYFSDDQELAIGKIPVRVLHTPGHAPGHVAFYFPTEKTLIGGDLILMGAIGRTDLPGANEDDLFASLRRVMALPPDTKLLPGHGHESLLSEERRTNGYVQHALSLV